MTGMEEGVLEIPQTSPTRYISGIVALNIPSERGTGDWHETSIFFTSRVRMPRSFIIERGQPFDPSDFLGSVGIYDAAAALDSMGVKHPEGPVYAASHARAIADLVIASVLRGEMLDHVGLDDWMPRGEDKAEVFELLKPVLGMLSSKNHVEVLRRWIVENMDDALSEASEELDPFMREAGLLALKRACADEHLTDILAAGERIARRDAVALALLADAEAEERGEGKAPS